MIKQLLVELVYAVVLIGVTVLLVVCVVICGIVPIVEWLLGAK